MKKTIFILILSLVFLFPVKTNAEFSIAKDSKSAVLIESTTGALLYEKDKDKQLEPASMTKIMTLVLIFDALEEGQISLDDVVTVSSSAASMGGSQVFLQTGEEMTINTLIKCIAISSANDAAVQMAEVIAGTEEAFVSLMNDKLVELNLSNTVFMNSTGLPEEGHLSSAYDMAMMGRHLITEYPQVLDYTKVYEDYIRKETSNPFWLVNTNK